MTGFTSPDDIRSRFSAAMSAMYRDEVPLYGKLIDIVSGVNARTLAANPILAERLQQQGELDRINAERHGAIRVGTAKELAILGRIFAVMGMHPVAYYDLAPAGIPVHSTAFRPVDEDGLKACPFRVFTSLLRLELIADAPLRAQAEGILAGRSIVPAECAALVEKAEREGGLKEPDAMAFVEHATTIFRWRSEALVDRATYERLHEAHRLIADIVAFPGPHINHLTPRTLDIDAAQAEMQRQGIAAKAVIEGPPRREVPILLRQTSFHALSEIFRPLGDDAQAQHTARFGEIEQRGLALTPAGRALYDESLAAAKTADGNDHEQKLRAAFADFPDSFEVLRERGLAYARYFLKDGVPVAEPVTYEDFLPVSAAGIFRSNLGDARPRAYHEGASQAAFEQALGMKLRDPFALYQAIEDTSRKAAFADAATANGHS